MTKLVLFDLDGVLVDTKQIHFDALNEALAKNGYPEISPEEHTLEYDGLTTEQKLIKYNVAPHEKNKIALRKQACFLLERHKQLYKWCYQDSNKDRQRQQDRNPNNSSFHRETLTRYTYRSNRLL